MFLLLFGITYLIVYLIFAVYYKHLKYGEKRLPSEAKYLINAYKLDIKKVNVRGLLSALAKINSLIISVIVTVVVLIKNFYIMILVGFVLAFVLTLITYHLLGKWLQKKGMKKNV